MGKTAFIFPGQGSQKVGMGADLLEERPELFDRWLNLADQASGLEIRKLCLEGPMEDLTSTDAAQPALFAVSLAVNEVAREAGLSPDFVAGHSLGEYTAAVAAGALGAEEGMKLVARRGRLMANAQSERPGAMAAIIGLPSEQVEELCERASEAGVVAPANLNTPVQTVCSGEDAAIDKLLELAEAADAKRAVRLPVGAAFHSELMKPVQEEMAAAMEEVEWSDPEVPLVGNASGEVKSTADEVREALRAQIASPVLWHDSVQTLIGEGCDTFLELGPGKVLTGLVRQIDSDVDASAADSPEKLKSYS